MEPVGFAVGLSGLVGVFTSCLEFVQRYDTYKTASRDKRSLDVQQQGAIYRLKHWGISVGIKDGKLSNNHHPALDNPETITLVNDLLSNIKEFLDSPNHLDGPSGVQKVPSSGSEKLPRLERVAWALGGRFRQTNHVQVLEPLVSLLYEVVPPDSAKSLSRTNSLEHALDMGLSNHSIAITSINSVHRSQSKS
jgi:hypothetical protein